MIVARCPPAWKQPLPVWGRPPRRPRAAKGGQGASSIRARLFNPGRFVDGRILNACCERVAEPRTIDCDDPPTRTPLPPANPGAGIDYELFLDCVHCGLCLGVVPDLRRTGHRERQPARPHLPDAGRHRRPARSSTTRCAATSTCASTAGPASRPVRPACSTAS